MDPLHYIRIIGVSFAIFFVFGYSHAAKAQCAPGYYCGPGTSYYPHYYPRGYPAYVRPLPPVQPRLPYLNPNAAFRYQKCFQNGPYVSCYPYPPPSYRYY